MEQQNSPLPYSPLPRSTSSRRGVVATGFWGLPRKFAPRELKRSSWREVKNVRGQIIIELLIAFGLAGILLPALLTGLIAARNGKVGQEQRIVAVGLLREGEEAVRSVRDEDWSNIAGLMTTPPANNYYYPSVITDPISGGKKWTLTLQNGGETINDFTRTITIYDVYRDAGGKIVAKGTPGATLDPSIRQFVVAVSWGNILLTNTTSTFYLTRWKNLSLSDTQQVTEPAGGFNDWCKPSLSTTNVNLIRQGHATSVSAFESSNGTGNRVFTGTGKNASGPPFSNIVIQGNSPPSVISVTDLSGEQKVNGVYGDTNYAFLATDKGVQIFNLSSVPYQQIGSFYNKPVNSIYVVGNTGYIVTDSDLYIFSISADRKTTNQIGVMNLTGGVRVLVDANNQYAYVATSDLPGSQGFTGQFKIIDVHTNPASPTVYSYVAVNGGAGRDVFIDFDKFRAYLATEASVTQPEFFIINISDPHAPVAINNATYDTNGMDPQGVAIVTASRAIIVGTGGNEYQVFSVINDQVSLCPNHDQNNDFLNIDAGVYGVATIFQKIDKHAYSYIVTGDASAELKIIEGGSGDGGAGGSGYYESPTLPVPDPGHDVAFNSFTATTGPNLTYMISIKRGAGSCSGVTFSDTDFTSFMPGPLPLTTLGAGYTNPGECLRYRAVNSGITPITYTITFNYSP